MYYTLGKFYLFTILHGLFYAIGGLVGYSKSGSLLCILVSCPLGCLLILLGIGHAIEYHRDIDIDKFYLTIPLLISMIIGILMICLYGLGARFIPSGLVGIISIIAFCIYIFALWEVFQAPSRRDERFAEIFLRRSRNGKSADRRSLLGLQ